MASSPREGREKEGKNIFCSEGAKKKWTINGRERERERERERGESRCGV